MTLIRPTAAATTLLVATLGLGSAAALAETSPYYIGLATSIAHDSNLERGPSGSASQPVLSDTYYSAGLRLGLDQSLGRQRLQARLDANRSQFQTYKAYDYSDYLLNARLDWASVERLSGTLQAETRQSLDRADVNSTRSFAGRNLVRTDSVSALARVGGPTMVTFDGGLSGSQVRYEVTPSRDLRQWTLSGGVSARPGSGLQLRLGGRHTRADYPQATTSGGDEVRRNDIDLGATAELSGASSLNARLSRTRETHQLQQARSYSTWTGQLGWAWRPTGKLGLNATLSRDSNIGNSGFDVGALSFDTSDTRLRNALALSANWEITGKLQLNAGSSYSRRTLDNALSVTGATSVVSARDRTVTWDLGLRYQPLRNVELGCGWHREDRSVSDPAATITYAYDVDVYTCSAQVFLR